MTKVVYGKTYDRFFLEMSGHALPSESDTETEETEKSPECTAVCAALSILAVSCAEMLEEMDGSGQFSSCSITLEDGYALFDVTPGDDESAGKTEVVFDVLIGGINYLEENYPEFVVIE